MFVRRAMIVAFAGGFVLGLANVAAAQVFGTAGDGSSVQGSGSSTIKCQPEVLRMQVDLSAKAQTLEEALAKLKAKRESAASKLAELGADAKSVEFGDAHIDTAVSMQQRQMEGMVRQRMRQLGRGGRKPTKKPITVSAQLTAEWKLSAASPEALLLEGHAIQQKVRDADLAAASDDEEQSEADAELAEEMAEMGADFLDPSQLKPGEPVFMYACPVSQEQQTKAYAEAFSKAKASAEQLSRAAGAELGPLRGLTAQQTPFNQFANYYGGYMDPMAQRVQQIIAQQSVESGGRAEEAIGSQPHEVTYPVHVTATFDVKQPAAK